ncbi:uncharacterized protein LOC143287622 [Babylonia areolata]|uniref:uncharacterized protein LOC143287622 n=1 Tax=Babylonia areolata TaxID=304850 RepID=UPI003FD16CF1
MTAAQLLPRGIMTCKVLFLCLALFVAGGCSQTCDKFASSPDGIMSQAVNGVCYYGVQNTYTWDDAKDICEGESTRLVHLQTVAKQQDVFQALGADFGQHWVGLRYQSSVWKWYVDSTADIIATDDVAGRFEGPETGPAAYTTTSSNMAKLKSVSLSGPYRPVCEDDTSTSSPDATDTANNGMYQKQTTLTTAQYLTFFPSTVTGACALRCLTTSGCSHFVFFPAAKNCSLYEESSSPTSDLPTCGGDENCYTLSA